MTPSSEMVIRLTVKLAQTMEGVDLSSFAEGDIIALADHDANLLIKGGWAERVVNEQRFKVAAAWPPAIAADRVSPRRPHRTMT